MTPVPRALAETAGESVGIDTGLGEERRAPEHPTPLDHVLARGRLRATLTMLGPAFVAAIAYVDPGNFATNVQGGARFGYALLWVVLLANLMAMLVQYLSAKLGIVTDRGLPELCRERYPRAVSVGLWLQAELMAMSTDIAEFLGAALGLNLLFGVPLFIAGLMTGVLAFAILDLQRRGMRRFELAITALLGVIFLGFLYETLRIGPSAPEALHGFLPQLHGPAFIYLGVGIVGATVMPHAIYLHSVLTNGRTPVRNDRERRRVLSFERLDVIIALTFAGLINLAMLAVAAKLFHTPALSGLSTIQQAHAEFGRLVGGGAAIAFAVALLASGASSSSVGTYAGQVVMSGFISYRIPLVLRRLVTMTPALVVLAIGVSPTDALVLSQVVLSFGIPFALVPLVFLTSNRGVMGGYVNGRLTTTLAFAVAGLISAMNVFLLYQQFLGELTMALADTFQEVVDSLPDDWTDLEIDLRIFDERRYVDASVLLVVCYPQPYSKYDWHWRILVAHRFGHAAAVPAVHTALRLLDEAGIAGELRVREMRTGRVEVVQMWGRPESTRREFKRLRAQ